MEPGKPPLSPFPLRRGLKVRRGCSRGVGPTSTPPLLPLYSPSTLPLPSPKTPLGPCGAPGVEVVAGPCSPCQPRCAPGTRCRRCAGTGLTPRPVPRGTHGAAPAPRPGRHSGASVSLPGEQLVRQSGIRRELCCCSATGRAICGQGGTCALPLAPSPSPARPPLVP